MKTVRECPPTICMDMDMTRSSIGPSSYKVAYKTHTEYRYRVGERLDKWEGRYMNKYMHL